jgi:hypothetical protein
MQDYEKLGLFYLGKRYDPARQNPTDELVLYDSKDLVTHAVCIGMTGSGKTGLCLSLIEEALIDGIPALIIDPKGDLANLLLTFPELRAEDFAPWIDEDDARRKGVSRDEFAAKQAEMWRKGLADWGQGGERIRRLRDAAELVIYTPGSSAGQPIAVLKSFSAPPAALMSDADLLRDRISATATSILALLGIEADPLRSREHILVSKVLEVNWTAGRDLDVATLIQELQKPPVQKVGALDVDTFFPPPERFALAMQLNNLLAAPGSDAWLEGVPLDVGALLYSPAGKPRAAILSIAHLSDPERMFFVSLLLNEVVAWMRTQSGTTSLRAILYMDEIFGYFPPVANPPSKQPLLTLLKQARAYGLGVVLATQNPVDLDYKGLANTGTWFIGRLQTERDKARVLEGLEGAAGGRFDRAEMERLIAGLGSRVFLLNNVHEDGPFLFHARWAMSYLRGPLTREQIKKLSGTHATKPDAPSVVPGAAAERRRRATAATRPALPPEITQRFLPLRGHGPAGAQLTYQGAIFGAASAYFADGKLDVETTGKVGLLAALDENAPLDWQEATQIALSFDELRSDPQEGAAFGDLPSAAVDPRSYRRWAEELKRWLGASYRINLWRSPSSKLVSRPDESERDFRIRLRDAGHELRDQKKEELREKYRNKQAQLEERLRRAQQVLDRETEQASQQSLQTAIGVGASILGAFLGRRSSRRGTLGRATTAARAASRVLKERGDIGRANENVENVQAQVRDLEAQLKDEIAALEAGTDPATEALETVALKPRKADVAVQAVALVWVPYWTEAGGSKRRGW